ncbi:Peptidoglycan O-acetyltransferase [Bradyrhizobium ivorense]|uniref:Probable alginate O-acetylase AlgI n=1 Tax=Bradyrhizobium ivorense TaxID=2511166 RepID=A0A508TQZ6_9BRAD|nr:MBOAT family O-acyltransferase [Bradyrhizobium ivorense]VIO76731.1 Peptidoglycan O-acetyltransferase [Bradyrhizobium ivorense]
MLFNSLQFLLLFLPITCAGFLVCRRFGNIQWVFIWLFICSATFYAAWEPRYLILLFGSIAGNYAAALHIARQKSKLVLGAAIAANLAVLGYFKYTNFILQTLAYLFHIEVPAVAIELPLGISFVSFIQIAFLVDVYRNRTDDLGLPKYALFVSYFPHLIAGPIIHHKEVMSQFTNERLKSISYAEVATGVAYILCGLFKKVIIADTMASYAAPGFRLANQAQPISFFDGWGAALAFTYQIYFDFSGYSDIAIGLSLLFGVRLPVNFDSPYKSASIIDFWRRWHITLSRFLRDYLYIPLGGNRDGWVRRYVNLMIVMLLGGLWHGASWLFVVWGGLHGIYLIINHLFRYLRERFAPTSRIVAGIAALCSLLVFPAVLLSWVFFRSESWMGAKIMLKAMMGGFGILVPEQYQAMLGSFAPSVMRTLHMQTGNLVTFGSETAVLWLVLVTLFVFILPNSQQLLLGTYDDKPGHPVRRGLARALAFRPTPISAIAGAFVGVLVLAIIYLGVPSEFIYFQF